MRLGVSLGRDWQNLDYLARGTVLQQKALNGIELMRINSLLANYAPTLIGILPLGFEIGYEELHFYCQSIDLEQFKARAAKEFGGCKNFKIKSSKTSDGPGIDCKFHIPSFQVNLQCSLVPVRGQHPYLRFLTVAKLLDLGRSKLHRQVQFQLSSGNSLEASIATCLGLKTDVLKDFCDYAYMGIPGPIVERALQFRKG